MKKLIGILIMLPSLCFATQYGRPVSDGSPLGCSPTPSGSHYSTMDESTPSSTDYVACLDTQVALDCGNATASKYDQVNLTSLSDPVSSSSHIVKWQCSASSGSGTWTLYSGATQVTAWAGTCTGSEQSTTLTSGQADSISDYTALFFYVGGTSFCEDPECGGGCTADVNVDFEWIVLEVPDAGAAARRRIVVSGGN